jgi:hypothetical protein
MRTCFPRRTRRRIAGLSLLLCMSFALLIWLKLRLVTAVPRTAYAHPEQPTPQGHSAPAR